MQRKCSQCGDLYDSQKEGSTYECCSGECSEKFADYMANEIMAFELNESDDIR